MVYCIVVYCIVLYCIVYLHPEIVSYCCRHCCNFVKKMEKPNLNQLPLEHLCPQQSKMDPL